MCTAPLIKVQDAKQEKQTCFYSLALHGAVLATSLWTQNFHLTIIWEAGPLRIPLHLSCTVTKGVLCVLNTYMSGWPIARAGFSKNMCRWHGEKVWQRNISLQDVAYGGIKSSPMDAIELRPASSSMIKKKRKRKWWMFRKRSLGKSGKRQPTGSTPGSTRLGQCGPGPWHRYACTPLCLQNAFHFTFNGNKILN